MFNSSRRFVSLVLAFVMMFTSIIIFPTTTVSAAEENDTIDFSTTKQRESQTTTKQVWKNGNVSLTNNKSSSSSNVANYSNPVRFYAGSNLVIETSVGAITKIIVTCDNATYASALKTSAGSEASVNGSVVTIIPSEVSSSYTITKLTAQVRVDTMVVYYTTQVCDHANITETVTKASSCTESGLKQIKCNDCDFTNEVQIPEIGHNYINNICSACGETYTIEPKTYVFSEYKAGTQYAKNESHSLDEYVTVVTNNCHFTTELRIYSSSTYNGYAIIQSQHPIYSLSVNAGYKEDTLEVYTSDNGSNWVLTTTIEVNSTSYKTYSVELKGVRYVKLDVKGSEQVRLKFMTLDFTSCKSGHTYGSDGFCSVCGSEQPAVNIGGTGYDSFAEAIGAAKDGDTILLNKDVVYSSELGLLNAVKIDLNGHTLTANAVALFASNASIVDSGATKGLVVVPKGYLAMSNSTGSMLPIWSEADGGYVFVDVEAKNLPTEIDEDSFKIVFRPEFDLASNAADFFKDGAENNGISIIVRINCIKGGAVAQSLSFLAPETNVQSIYTNNKALAFTVNGADDSFDSYEVVVVLQSDTGMEISEVIGSFAGGVYSNAN